MIAVEPLPRGGSLPPGGAYSCSQAWAELYTGLYGYKLYDFAVLRRGAVIGGFRCAAVRSAVFGDRLISLPFSDESPLWLRQGEELSAPERGALRAALAAALAGPAGAERADYAELRGADRLSGGGDGLFVEAAPYLRLVLDLARPYAELRGNYHINLVKNLRKADKTVEVAESRDPAAFSPFYGIYLRQMRLFGSPPLPAAHFERLLAAGLGRLYTAAVGGRPAAFLFAQVWDGTFYADVNAGLPEYETFFPKVRLFDETIRRAGAEGLRRYDFMRTRAGSGVHEHKRKWGGAETPIKYFFRLYREGKDPGLDPEQARFALPRLLLRRSPLPLLRAFGPAIRRHAGK